MTAPAAPTGVLLLAYGTPDSLEDVEAYYTHIRRGRPPTAEALADLTERYRRVGGRTPLRDLTEAVARRLQETLDSEDAGRRQVWYAMKHWHPYIADVVPRLAAEGIEQVVAIALAPHYSRYSIGGYLTAIEAANRVLPRPLTVRFVESWHAQPRFQRLIADRIVEALATFSPGIAPVVLFSAHSLPARIVQDGDPYPRELHESAQAVAGILGLADWRFAYQSASPTGEPWLGPDILDALDQLAAEGRRAVLSVPIGFVAEHLEVLYDIDVEARERAAALGMELRRIAMPNADPAFIAVLADIVRELTSGAA